MRRQDFADVYDDGRHGDIRGTARRTRPYCPRGIQTAARRSRIRDRRRPGRARQRDGSPFHLRVDLPLYLRRLAEPTPINTLVKLFVLDQWVEAATVEAALRPLELRDVRRMGLVENGPAGVRARVRLSGYDGLILAHDRYDEEAPALHPDHGSMSTRPA